MKRLIFLLAWSPILLDMGVCFFLETHHVMPRLLAAGRRVLDIKGLYRK
jgi:hypothetical protein